MPGEDLFVIKGSGVDYDELTCEGMTVCDLDGNAVDGVSGRRPSDTAAHAYVYRNMPEVNGVRCTRTARTPRPGRRAREEIPCVLTAMADEFGGPIPVGPFALIGDDSIGQGIVATLTGSRSPAVLMQNHGVFTIGPYGAGRRQGRRHDRGRRPHRAPLPPAAASPSRSRRRTSTRSTRATRTSTARDE